jgi:hypothetical protein
MLSTIAVLIALLSGSGFAQALDAAKAKAITDAANSFAMLAKDSSKSGKPPRLGDRAAKPLLDLVFDTSELQAGGIFKMADIGNLNTWQLAVQKIGAVYLLAGTGMTAAALPTDPKAIEPKAVERINQNTATFAPELGRYVDAQLWLQVALIDTISGFLANAPRSKIDDPNIRSGIAQMRTGVAQTVTGIIVMWDNPGLRDEWRRARLPALWALAPLAAKFLLPEDVRVLRDTATGVAAKIKDPAVKTGLSSFVGMLGPT